IFNSHLCNSRNSSSDVGEILKVPIHLVKRQRAVLIKDIEKIAPQLERIESEDGQVIFSYTPLSQISSSTETKANGDPSLLNQTRQATVKNVSPEIETFGSNILDHPRQSQPGFIPIHEDADERPWYIILKDVTTDAENRASPNTTSSPPCPTTSTIDENNNNEDRNQLDKASTLNKEEINGRDIIDIQDQPSNWTNLLQGETRSCLNSALQSDHTKKSRSCRNVIQTNFSTLPHEQMNINGQSRPSEQSCLLLNLPQPSTPTITTAAVEATAAEATTAVAISIEEMTKELEPTSMLSPTAPCTSECKHTISKLHDQIAELAQALIYVLDGRVDNGSKAVTDENETEHIRNKALEALRSYTSSDNAHRVNHGLVTPETTPTSTPVMSIRPQRRFSLPDSSSYIRSRTSQNSESESNGSMALALSNHDRDPILQDSVSHFSGYRMSFPSKNTNSTSEAGQNQYPEDSTELTTTGPNSQTKTKNRFLAIFGKNRSDSLQGSGEASGSLTLRDKDDVMKGKDKQGSGQGKSRSNSWFNPSEAKTSRWKITTSKKDNQHQNHASASSAQRSNWPSSYSSSTSSNCHEFLSASSSLTPSPNLTPMASSSRENSSRRPSTASATPRPTTTMSLPIFIPTMATTTVADMRLDAAPSTSAIAIEPRHRQQTYQHPESLQQRQSMYSSTNPNFSSEPVTQTAINSFFDSVSDDESDTDDEVLQRHGRSHVHSSNQPTSQSYNQLQQNAQRVIRHEVHDRDQVTDSDSNSDYVDSESERSTDYDQERFYPHMTTAAVINPSTGYNSLRQFDPHTLEGYDHQFDDAPPPSYHSLIRADDSNNTIVSSSHSAFQLQHQPISMINNGQSILQILLNCLHEFEDHIPTQFKTPAFREPSDSIDTSAGSTTRTVSSRRHFWRSRNPETIASFAYILMELEQVGILPTAMQEGWRRRSSGSTSTLSPFLTFTNIPVSTTSTSSLTVSPPATTINEARVMSTAIVPEVSEQDWLTMTGNASTESHLAKAMLILEQNCVQAMDPIRWHGCNNIVGSSGNGEDATAVMESTTQTRDRWIAQVAEIANASVI
ncbi:hypothetical protein BGZ46_002485, partial [Entomortierella lignicola]